MHGHDMIAIGASAGGIEALTSLVRDLPPSLPASLFVVLHIPATAPSLLPKILTRAGSLTAVQPADKDPIEPGFIYVAPPDHHLIVHRGYVRIVRGPKENRSRPAVDPLFRSVASAYGPRAVGVVLTGALDDGAAGLLAIKRAGGTAIVQDPEEALYPSMPLSAIETVEVDAVLPVAEIGARLVSLVHTPVPEGAEVVPAGTLIEVELAEMRDVDQEILDQLGAPSHFACPTCHGTLWELKDGDLFRYRCRIGHAFSPDSLLAEHSESVEEALWAAVRALEESVALSKRLAESSALRGQNRVARRFQERATKNHEQAGVLRNLLQSDSLGAQEATGL